MFFRETKETEKDIVLMFHQIREKMKQRVVLKNKKKKSDAGNFVVPCLIGGIDYPLYSLCDTGSSVSVMPKVMADHLSLQIEPYENSFTFMDCSKVNSGYALVPVDFHGMDSKINWNSYVLLGRAFMAIVGAACNMHTNQLYLTLIDSNAYYDPVRVVKGNTPYIEIGNDP